MCFEKSYIGTFQTYSVFVRELSIRREWTINYWVIIASLLGISQAEYFPGIDWLGEAVRSVPLVSHPSNKV